jgi:hypothetical protein
MKPSRHSAFLLSCNPATLLPFALALSVFLRVGIALYLGDVVDAPPLLTDQRSYHALGQRLIEGHRFTFAGPWYPFTPANTPTAHWSFLYSLFVAAVYSIFGAHPLVVRLVQAVLGGVLLPWMVYRLAKHLFYCNPQPTTHNPQPLTLNPQSITLNPKPQTPTLPLLSAFLTAVYAYFALYAATIMTETFYIVALLWSLEVSLRLGKHLRQGARPPWTLTLQLGISLGVATLLRQSILPWVPVLYLWLLWQAWHASRSVSQPSTFNLQPSTCNPQPATLNLKPAILTLLLVSAILLFFILPFTIRNYLVYDDFLLLNSNTGFAMYSAQHPMHGTSFREFHAAPVPADLRGLNEARMDGELMLRGIQFILDDPVRYLLLSLSRVRAYFEFWPSPDTSLLHNIGRVGSFGLFLPFILYGLYLAIRNLQPATCNSQLTTHNSLIFLFITFYSALHIFTWAMIRYRLPVDAVLLPYAALAIIDLTNRLLCHFPGLSPFCKKRE